jgi:hypothetical protein
MTFDVARELVEGDVYLMSGLDCSSEIYAVSNPDVLRILDVNDPAMTIPSVKKRAIKHCRGSRRGTLWRDHPHRFGMSDDDPQNVVLAISAMRDCKLRHPDKRFFVINTNRDEFVKLEIFDMDDPVTAAGRVVPFSPTRPIRIGTHKANACLLLAGNASLYVTDIDRAVAFYTERVAARRSLG